jgi:hypothetical protein
MDEKLKNAARDAAQKLTLFFAFIEFSQFLIHIFLSSTLFYSFFLIPQHAMNDVEMSSIVGFF